MTENRSMPPGAIIPVLPVGDVVAAERFLTDAFGFVPRLRIGTHRIQLTLDGESVVVTDSEPSAPVAVMLRVDDADKLVERAVAAGGTVLAEPADYPFGERQAAVADPFGHNWTLSQSVADVDPATWGGALLPLGD